MVAVGESANDRLRNCFCVQLDMGKGHDLVFKAVVEEHRHVWWEACREIWARLDVVARPAAFTDERRSDEKQAPEPRARQVLSQHVNQDRGANRVAHEDCTLVELAELAE